MAHANLYVNADTRRTSMSLGNFPNAMDFRAVAYSS